MSPFFLCSCLCCWGWRQKTKMPKIKRNWTDTVLQMGPSQGLSHVWPVKRPSWERSHCSALVSSCWLLCVSLQCFESCFEILVQCFVSKRNCAEIWTYLVFVMSWVWQGRGRKDSTWQLQKGAWPSPSPSTLAKNFFLARGCNIKAPSGLL